MSGLQKKILRRVMCREQFGRCCYCGEPVLMDTESRLDPRYGTTDHVVPRAAGGSDRESNKVLACYRCNSLKGDMALVVFLARCWEAITCKDASVQVGRLAP